MSGLTVPRISTRLIWTSSRQGEYIDRYKNIAEPTRRTYAAMVTCMDDEIGRVVAAIDKKGLRDNTLIIFQSDNGGTKSKMFTGQMADVSQIQIPCDNGPYRDGKGMLYEGGTLVCALANWPGHIKPGSTVDGIIHAVDMYPTFAKLGGASIAKCKPLDGMDVWQTISEGKPSPRTEIVYNIEPFRAAVRDGDWKLVWRTILPSNVELFNLGSLREEQPRWRPSRSSGRDAAARRSPRQASRQAARSHLYGPDRHESQRPSLANR
jgi:arylsulfatase A-like enzyme